MTFGLHRCPFLFQPSSPPPVFFLLTPSIYLPSFSLSSFPSSLSPALPSYLSTPSHRLFLLACCYFSFFFFLFWCLSPLFQANVTCAVSRTVVTNQAAHSSRVICVTENLNCALSPLSPSSLSPLTATSPLYHRRADQIGTGPSQSELDKWKVAM